MQQPDFTGAVRYALNRLQHELSPDLCYHNLWHTCDEVVPTVEHLAHMSGVDPEELLLLRTAAYYHDIGFVEQRADHELVGVRIAAEVLPGFGYNPSHIAVIRGIILATRLPQTPHTPLEQMLADADLSVLGRPDFLTRNQALRNELTAFGATIDEAQWYRQQLTFLQTHEYWTTAARTCYDAGKQDNSAILAGLLQTATS